MSPFETAHRIKAWLELTPEKRAEIEAMPLQADQQKRLAELAQHVRLAAFEPDREGRGGRAVGEDRREPPVEDLARHAAEKKKGDPTKYEKAKRRIAANYYFLEKPPAAVEPGRLMRFEAALPPWYRGEFDHLPARGGAAPAHDPLPADLSLAQRHARAHQGDEPAGQGAGAHGGDTAIIALPPPPRPGSARG